MPLAKYGDPYVADNGRVVLADEESDALPRGDVVIGAPVARKIVSTERRTIQDLPIEEKTQTVINVVMVYQLLGLTETEIAHITHVEVARIQELKKLPAYQETFEVLFHQFISINSNSLQAKIAAFAGPALDNVMHIADKAENEMARLKANQDILDRSGMHPETLFGKSKQDDGFESLKIVIQDSDDDKMKVNIDLQRK